MTPEPELPADERKEAARLAWKSLRIPFGSMLLGTLLVLGILSATVVVWDYGPANPIP